MTVMTVLIAMRFAVTAGMTKVVMWAKTTDPTRSE
jgi:hypothetical protein